MESPTPAKKYKPSNWKELVKKYRKVIPPDLSKIPSLQQAARIERRNSTNSGLKKYTGAWEVDQVAHLLKRTLFGIKKSELNSFSNLTLEEAVESLLQTENITPPVNNYTGWDNLPVDPSVPPGEYWHEAPYGEEYEGPRIVSLKGWLIRNILEQSPSIHQKMILFWHNLLPTQAWDVFNSRASYQYYEMLSNNALGNFKSIIKELTIDPAMLFYLNGAFNNKDAPDENYARELQELFTIGKGPGSGYTESDVAAAARILTGWTVRWEDFGEHGRLRSFFHYPSHDTGDKQFSEFYGKKIIKGLIGPGGSDETDQLIDMLFDTDEAAKYICRRLYNFFVYSETNEAIEEMVISPLAQIFRENNYEIKPVLKALFESEHFFDPLNIGAIIKSPTDMLLGAMRTFNIQNPDANRLTVGLQFNVNRIWEMSGWGMELGDPPSVSGWPAYYQAPQFDKSWITTDTITKRAIHTDAMTYWGLWITDGLEVPADFIELLKSLDKPEDPGSLIEEVSTLLLGVPLQDESKNQLKEILLSGQSNESYWTSAWLTYMGNPSEANRSVVENRLKPMFQFLMQTGEFQLF